MRHMGAVNNLTELDEKFSRADNGVDVSLLGFFSLLLNPWNTDCKGCCVVTVKGFYSGFV